MAIDGHILCGSKKCSRVLYLGKHKDGRFWVGGLTPEQIATGIHLFIEEHFVHGTLKVLGDDSYGEELEDCLDSDWPITVQIEVDEQGKVYLQESDPAPWRLRHR